MMNLSSALLLTDRELFSSRSVQTAGLGGLRPNCIMLDWPYGWNATPTETSEPPPARSAATAAGTGTGVGGHSVVNDMSGSLSALRQQHQRQYLMNHNAVAAPASTSSVTATPASAATLGALGSAAPPAASATRSRGADWHMFVEAVRAAAEAPCACLVVKGAEPLRSQRFPRCSDQWAAYASRPSEHNLKLSTWLKSAS